MWSYYGAKTTIVHAYPKPMHDKIIEPFAGTARYALRWFEKDVLLVDKYEVIVKIWKWLQTCSEKDVLGLPRFMKSGQTLSDFSFDCEEARLLMGFLLAKGSQSPREKVSDRVAIARPNSINHQIKTIASQLFKIKHWEIRLGSFDEIENEKATWFVDPPYQFGGQVYVQSNRKIDFKKLSEWSKSRQGQVIVCENSKADWMDFKQMIQHKGSAKETQMEVIWSNQPTVFDNIQTQLFQEKDLVL